MSGVHRALHGLTHSFPTRRSSDLPYLVLQAGLFGTINIPGSLPYRGVLIPDNAIAADQNRRIVYVVDDAGKVSARQVRPGPRLHGYRSEEHTSELQSLMRRSYAVFCLKKKNTYTPSHKHLSKYHQRDIFVW